MTRTSDDAGPVARIRERLALERGTLARDRTAPVVLCYPSPYRVGMSSLGFQTLYRLINEDGPGAHRAFLPDEWEAQSLSWPQPRRPILAYESERPVSDYGVLAFSVAYELELAGLIRFLEGAGIPLLAANRQPRDPVVVAGGPLTNANPSALLPFVDLLIAGDGEEVLPRVLAALLDSGPRARRIAAATAVPHTGPGELEPGVFAELPTPATASREHLPARSAIVTPDTELSDMFLIEPERGCSRACTFCVMRGPTTGGMRLLEIDRVLAHIPAYATKVGLVGAAVTDHPDLERLVGRIVEDGRGVGVSSLRADRLTPSLLASLGKAGHRTVTVASDGISERLRRFLRRQISEQDLLSAAQQIRAGGFHRMKLYQMIGVPGESDADVDELIRFNRELAKIVRLTITVSTFVAKRNTPLDGAPFLGTKLATTRLRAIRLALRGQVEVRPQPPKWAEIEYRLAQAGPRAGHAAIEAVHRGGGYRAWTDALDALPTEPRTPMFGDEARLAGRRGHAATRPRLPVLEAG